LAIFDTAFNARVGAKVKIHRSGKRLPVCKGIFFQYVDVPNQMAINTWGYFEKACPADKHYSSAHYIIDLNGDIYHARCRQNQRHNAGCVSVRKQKQDKTNNSFLQIKRFFRNTAF
jgi:hypothetical protein